MGLGQRETTPPPLARSRVLCSPFLHGRYTLSLSLSLTRFQPSTFSAFLLRRHTLELLARGRSEWEKGIEEVEGGEGDVRNFVGLPGEEEEEEEEMSDPARQIGS